MWKKFKGGGGAGAGAGAGEGGVGGNARHCKGLGVVT